MFAVELTFGVVVYPLVGVILLTGLWWFYDRRDRQFFDQTRRRTTFHCLKCQQVYSSTVDHELSRCPKCGHENARLHF